MRFTGCLAGALLAPFALRTLVGVEPYPALLFPDGASVIRVEGGVAQFRNVALYAQHATRAEVRLDPRAFMAPIPVHYLRAIADRGFGQAEPRQRTRRLGFLGEWSLPEKSSTPRERAEARRWLHERVSSAAPAATALVIRSEQSRMPVTGEWRTAEVVNELTFPAR